MKDVTANSAKKTAQKVGEVAQVANDRTPLDGRYGQIGISAVAAAVRYQGAAKNPAYAPAVVKWDARSEEAA
jgi:hypothetical protein